MWIRSAHSTLRREFHEALDVLFVFYSWPDSASSRRLHSAKNRSLEPAEQILQVPDAIAATEAEMKPYAEPIEHTELKIEMVPIPGGTFVMGSPESEADRNEDEGPQHEVKVSPFWIGKFEITWDQYDTWGEQMDQLRRKMMSVAPTPRDVLVDGISKPTEPYTDMSFGMGRGSYPAICMTQHAARTYCKWLTAKTGRYYRLPTEAEWEYACRAGTTTAYSFGDDPDELEDYAWFYDNSDDQYQEVGQKQPNPWGLARHARQRCRMGLGSVRRRLLQQDGQSDRPVERAADTLPAGGAGRRLGRRSGNAPQRRAGRFQRRVEATRSTDTEEHLVSYRCARSWIPSGSAIGRTLRAREGREVGKDRAGTKRSGRMNPANIPFP